MDALQILNAQLRLVLRTFDGLGNSAGTARDETYHHAGIHAIGGRALGGIQHAQPSGGARTDVNQPAAFMELLRNDIHRSGNMLKLCFHRSSQTSAAASNAKSCAYLYLAVSSKVQARVKEVIESMTGLAVADVGIRVCGDVKAGMITPVHKPRGAKKATETLVEMMKERGFYDGAQLRIAHCFGEKQAQALAEATLAQFPNARITIEPTTALCSFYAEAGGLMIGFEGGYNAENDPDKF